MRRLFPLLPFLVAAVAPPATGVSRPAHPAAGPTAAPAPGAATPARGLAFALALKGSGEVLATGPFLLKVPGGAGPLRLDLSRLAVDGARLRGEVTLRNGSGLLLAGLALDFESASPARRDVSGQSAVAPVPLSLRSPLAAGDLLPGETTPPIPFEVAPVPLGADVALTTLLGAVSGFAVEKPVTVANAPSPVALDVDRGGALYVATAGVGRVLRLAPSAGSTPGEAARPASPPTGIAIRRKTGDLLVAAGGPLVELWRPGRARPATLDAGRPVTALRVDGKGILRAASGNAVLAFEEAKAGAPLALGPEGAEVVSFDADAGGMVWAVVREGDARRLVVAGPSGRSRFVAKLGAGSDALEAPTACRLDGAGALWVAASPLTPAGSVVARFAADGTPLGTLPRAALALYLGKDEEAAVPAVVDLAPGADGRLWLLLEGGALLAVRAF